jgi:hypothetical protein
VKLRASSAQRYALCPGSYKAEDGLPDKPSQDAERGTAVHSVLADLIQLKVGPVQPVEIVDTAIAMFDKFQQLVAEHGGKYTVRMCEERVNGWDWSGQPDAVVEMADGTVWIIDWKSGWGEVDDACENAQLRVYVMLVSQLLDGDPYYAAIIQPQGKPTVVKYEREAMPAVLAEMEAIKQGVVLTPDLRVPGPAQCKYCKAFGTDRCPESVTAVTVQLATDLATPMSLQAATGIYALKAMADKLIKLAEERIREAIAAGEPCGYVLGKPRVTKKITDAALAFIRLSLPEAAIFDCASISMPKLVDAYAKERGMQKKYAQAAVEVDLADIIETTESKPPLEKAQ